MQMNIKVHWVWKSNLGLTSQNKFDPINQLIPLSVIIGPINGQIKKLTNKITNLT